jgi:hypothetical protein
MPPPHIRAELWTVCVHNSTPPAAAVEPRPIGAPPARAPAVPSRAVTKRARSRLGIAVLAVAGIGLAVTEPQTWWVVALIAAGIALIVAGE